MRRINLFPDPNLSDTLKPYTPDNTKMEYAVVDGMRWIRATTVTPGDNYTQYSLTGDLIPPVGEYHAHARAFAQHADANFRIYVRKGDSYLNLVEVRIPDGQTVDVDSDFTIPDGCEELILRIAPAASAGAIGMMSQILIESKTTYDFAIGGGFQASSPGTRCRSTNGIRRAGDVR